MNKIYAGIFLISLAFLGYSCNNHAPLLVEPISQEYNDSFLTGKGLDARYFSTKDVVQYYQVSNFSSLPPHVVLAKLGDFAKAHYPLNRIDSIKNLSLFFYEKKLFTDYSKQVYESARDNENRTLEGYADDLIAWIIYERLKNDNFKVVRSRYFISHHNQKPVELRDTFTLR